VLSGFGAKTVESTIDSCQPHVATDRTSLIERKVNSNSIMTTISDDTQEQDNSFSYVALEEGNSSHLALHQEQESITQMDDDAVAPESFQDDGELAQPGFSHVALEEGSSGILPRQQEQATIQEADENVTPERSYAGAPNNDTTQEVELGVVANTDEKTATDALGHPILNQRDKGTSVGQLQHHQGSTSNASKAAITARRLPSFVPRLHQPQQ
jgi:hypothetical protein